MSKARLYTTAVSFVVGVAMWAIPVATHAASDCRNMTTGSMSLNTCTIVRNRNVGVSQSNLRNVFNLAVSDNNTGDNRANQNTGGGLNRTGRADTRGLFSSHVSGRDIMVSGSSHDDQTGENSITGSDSINVVSIVETLDLSVDQTNDTIVGNTVVSANNTGGNDASENTLGGENNTGDATLDVDAITTIDDGSITVNL